MALLLTGRWDAAERDQYLTQLQAQLPGEPWVLDAPRDAAEAASIEVAVVANPAQGLLQQLPNLRLIQSLWAGVDKLLADPTLPAAVPLARMVDPAMNEAMVQTALWAVLGQHRHFFELQLQQREAVWRQPPQLRAHEWQVLVLGLGELGGRVARTLALLGYAVTGYSTRETRIEGVEHCVHGEAALAEALARADTVINLLPLTEATRGFFDAARFAQMKRGAGLVNLARGAQVVEADLLAALDAQQIRHALLDVFQTEPLPAEHAFWWHPGVTVLPHTAAQTDPRSACAVVAANVRALREGRPLAHLVERGRGY